MHSEGCVYHMHLEKGSEQGMWCCIYQGWENHPHFLWIGLQKTTALCSGGYGDWDLFRCQWYRRGWRWGWSRIGLPGSDNSVVAIVLGSFMHAVGTLACKLGGDVFLRAKGVD